MSESADDSRDYRKHSVSLPASVSDAVTRRVGKREFSAYLAMAAARQLERDALDDVLADMEAEHGPVAPSEVDAIAARLADR